MKITRDNYHSKEVNLYSFNSSQIKDFKRCENLAIHNIENCESEERKECYRQGHFSHAWNEGPEHFLTFKQDNPEIFTKKNELKAAYRDIENALYWLEQDSFIMEKLSGRKEVVFVVDMFGHKCRIMIDSWNRFKGSISDLKGLKSLTDRYWCNAERKYKGFVTFYNYDTSMAFYCEVERLAVGKSDYCFPYLVAFTKEKQPNKEVIKFADTQEELKQFVAFHLTDIAENIDRWAAIKKREIKPSKCGVCPVCISQKMIVEATHYHEYL